MEIQNHKALAIDCFNAIWKILEKDDPTDSDKLEAIRLAHTSTWHWYQCGEPVHFQRGEWICSRVYVHFNHLEEALYHARLCRELTKQYDLKDFDLSFSYEAMARVYNKLGNREKFQQYIQMLEESIGQIQDEEDKRIVIKDLESLR